ncbi:MAG TPA: outer membrane beta-barrel protein [Terracidiphilus sp.]|nr:outer membrane beta-barrel protein [Terracidiphilus sp.]
MRIHSSPVALLVLAVGLAASASAQTSVGLSLYGAFNQSTSGNNTAQSPSNSAGGLIELRHIGNPILGFEATYSYNRANQHYVSDLPASACPTTGCNITPTTVKANAHELTLDWIPSVPLANLRLFGVLGLGLLLNQATGNQSSTTNSTQPVYVYGAGLDWGLLPHLGLRFQYRGNLYKAPHLSTLYSSTDAFTHNSEPMIGAYLSF